MKAGTVRRLLKREIDEEALRFIQEEDEIFLGIDEHSLRHQELVYTVTEVKKRKVLGILRDDRIATLKKFPRYCIEVEHSTDIIRGLFRL